MQAAALAVERAKKVWRLFRSAFANKRIPVRLDAMPSGSPSAACAAIIMGAGPALMAYHGARVASHGGKPDHAIAVPSGTGPILLDMATSTISKMVKFCKARATGQSLPEGTVLTADGDATTDPRQAEILLPLGGAEGIGSRPHVRNVGERAGIGADPGARAPAGKSVRGTPATRQCLPSTSRRSGPFADFTHDADALAAVLKSLPRQAGVDEILLPGERSARTEAARRKSGIPIPPKLWEELEGIAKARAIKMPALTSSLAIAG